VEKIDYPNSLIFINKSFVNFFDYINDVNHLDVIYLIDENVLRIHKNLFSSHFKFISVASGEQVKSLQNINEIIQKIISLGGNKSTCIIGVGGGVTCDVAGFIASIFMRGVRFGFIPTTLLAITDASFGGKNGVNFNNVKNVLGVINEPDFVFIDYSFLKTLPSKEFVNGFAEIIKHACISSHKLFVDLEKNIDDYLQIIKSPENANFNRLNSLICDSIKIKLDIVCVDRNEGNLRKNLNYGHTFGHAIESKFNLSHGSAISLGMIFSNMISNKLGYIANNELLRISNLLASYGLPVDTFNYNKSDLMLLVQKDKKSSGTTIDFVMLKEIGSSVIESLNIQKIIDA
jgi:3-dehydroquinate synthase